MANRLHEDIERLLDGVDIVCIGDMKNVPSIREKSFRDILGKRQPRASLERDVIVVVDPAEIVEPEMAGQRCCFRTNTFHETAVTTNGVDVVVEDLKVRPVVVTSQPLLCDRHTHARCNSLS